MHPPEMLLTGAAQRTTRGRGDGVQVTDAVRITEEASSP